MKRAGFLIFSFVISALPIPLSAQQKSANDSLSWGILVPKNATLARAWEVPRDPTAAKVDNNSPLMKSVKRGFALFMNTSTRAPRLSGGAMACNNCHPNGGQRENAMPLVGVARIFPEYNKRSGRMFTLEERIVGCLLRSINATGSRNPSLVTHHENDLVGSTLNSLTQEVKDLAAYITWLSSGLMIDKTIPWRGRNTLPTYSLLPLQNLDPELGRKYFDELCATCHGKDGQGTGALTFEIAKQLGIKPKHPGPLWGPKSWNDGAGAARTYTLAGMIRHWMPYLTPGILTDEQAQHIAAFITSQPRPGYPYKEKDYLKEKIPLDAVYYRKLYSKNPLSDK